MKHFSFFFFVAAFLLLGVPSAQAQGIGGSVSPSSRNVALNAPTTITINWVITRLATPNVPIDLDAAIGRFRSNANALTDYATTRTLSRTIPNGSLTTVTITETVTVPAAVARKALDDNNGNFIYTRAFTDDNFATATVEELNLHVTSGMGGVLSVNAAELSFDDGAIVRNVDLGDTLSAVARLQSSGAGTLKGVWEVSGPGDTSSFYRTLQRVQQTVASGRAVSLRSPALPTDSTGRRKLRFRVTSPVTDFDAPRIDYFVTDGQEDSAPAKLPAISAASKDDIFSWKAVDTTVTYRLDIFDRANPPRRVTAMQVRGSATESGLSDFVRGKLDTGASYLWRVVAINNDGRAIARSALQVFTPVSK